MNFRFAAPWLFLFLIPLFFAAWRMLRRPSRPTAIPFAPIRFLPTKTATWRGFMVRALPWFFTVGASLLIVAAARPQTFFARETRSVDAIAIAMVVDVSGSMQALDLASNPHAPNAQTRLDVVKDEFGKFIDKRPDDLISLITFGGFASTRCPLTADHGAVMQYLDTVAIPGMGADDEGRQVSSEETLTAVGDGLTTACARLQESELKTKIVVLLSDGVSNTGLVKPTRAAAIAKELGIKVYAIGIGSKTGQAPFRTHDAFGRSIVAMGLVEFDEAELKSLSETTGGRYYSVTDKAGFSAVMKEIDALEKTHVERDVYNNYNERFVVPLLTGAALLVLAVSVGLICLRRPL